MPTACSCAWRLALRPVNTYWPKKPGHVRDTCQTTYSDVQVHGAKMRTVLQQMSNDQICSQQTVTVAKMPPKEVCGKKCGWEQATWPSSHTWVHEIFKSEHQLAKKKLSTYNAARCVQFANASPGRLVSRLFFRRLLRKKKCSASQPFIASQSLWNTNTLQINYGANQQQWPLWLRAAKMV